MGRRKVAEHRLYSALGNSVAVVYWAGRWRGSQKNVQLHPLPGVSFPQSSCPASAWLILSGSRARENQGWKFPLHPHPRGIGSIDLGRAQLCAFWKALKMTVTQVVPTPQFEKTLYKQRFGTIPEGIWSQLSQQSRKAFLGHTRTAPWEDDASGPSQSHSAWPGTHQAFSSLRENVLTSFPTQPMHCFLCVSHGVGSFTWIS